MMGKNLKNNPNHVMIYKEKLKPRKLKKKKKKIENLKNEAFSVHGHLTFLPGPP